MRIVGQMKGIRARPFDDDDYGMDPQGMVAVGGYWLTSIITARESDYPTNIRNRFVIRSFAPSLSAREVGRVEVWQQYMNTTDTLPPESLPYPSNGYDLASLVKLDETRLLAVLHHGTGTWQDTSAASTAISTAFVVTVGSDGKLTRGPYVAIEDAVLGGIEYWSNFYEGPPVLALTGADTVTYAVKAMTPRHAATTSDAVASLELKVSGTTVTVGAWSKWVETVRGDGVGRPYPQGVFGFGGAPYIVTGNAPLADLTYGPMLYGATPGGPGWELGQDWDKYLRANLVGGDAHLLAQGQGDLGYRGIVDRFDGTLVRLRDSMSLPPDPDDGYVGGAGWAPPEPELMGPDGKMIIWTWGGNTGNWRVGVVSPAGYAFQYVDLAPLLTPAWINAGDSMTVAVVGRYAVVEVLTTNAGDGMMDAAYFLIELVAPPRVGPGVQGAHFAG